MIAITVQLTIFIIGTIELSMAENPGLTGLSILQPDSLWLTSKTQISLPNLW